jgi:hypothetical protein
MSEKYTAEEMADAHLRRLREEDPHMFDALRPDPRHLGRVPWGRGWTGAVFPANTVRSALALPESEYPAPEICERLA